MVLRQTFAMQHSLSIIHMLTAVFFFINLIYVYTYSYILKLRQIKTSMFIWENNPLTFKFLVTSFGIAVSLYTSFFFF